MTITEVQVESGRMPAVEKWVNSPDYPRSLNMPYPAITELLIPTALHGSSPKVTIIDQSVSRLHGVVTGEYGNFPISSARQYRGISSEMKVLLDIRLEGGDSTNTLEIVDFWIRSNALQRRGIGGELFGRIEEFAKKSGYLYLHVFGSPTNIDFYKKQGMNPISNLNSEELKRGFRTSPWLLDDALNLIKEL